MKFILTAGWEDGIADLTQCIVKELSAGKKVLWLLSGGSNIPVSIEVMDKISSSLSQNLTISLADERFGKDVDYTESNWTKLIEAGFKAKKATLKPVVIPGQSFDQAVDHYEEIIKQGFADNDVIFAQLGIGEDGHIAGILPGSPASSETKTLVSGYQSQPFLRLTLTFKALKKVDVAYAYAFGSNKHNTLSQLQNENLPPQQQPAQILKQIKKAFLYSDQVGDNA